MAVIDPNAVAVEYVKKRVDEELSTFRVSVDVNQLAAMTGASASTLEHTFIPLQYVQELQRSIGERGGKRVWLFPEISTPSFRNLDEKEA